MVSPNQTLRGFFKMKKLKLKFKADPYSQVGDLVRHFYGGYKFWRIVKIENGVASASPVRENSSEKPACC